MNKTVKEKDILINVGIIPFSSIKLKYEDTGNISISDQSSLLQGVLSFPFFIYSKVNLGSYFIGGGRFQEIKLSIDSRRGLNNFFNYDHHMFVSNTLETILSRGYKIFGGRFILKTYEKKGDYSSGTYEDTSLSFETHPVQNSDKFIHLDIGERIGDEEVNQLKDWLSGIKRKIPEKLQDRVIITERRKPLSMLSNQAKEIPF